MKRMASFYAVIIGLYHLYIAIFGVTIPQLHKTIHLCSLLSLGFLLHPFSKKNHHEKVSLPDLILVLFTFLVGIYLILNIGRLEVYTPLLDPVHPLDYVFGILLILLLIEGARRTIGIAMSILGVLALLYMYFGHYVPGIFVTPSFSIRRIVEFLFLGREGIWGIAIQVSSTYIFAFVLFASFLAISGLGNFIMDFCSAIAGGITGGPAKIAVSSGVLTGTICGSPVSDVMMSGSFTIPMMKKLGYNSVFAGAVEASSSTGGALMPPIMGSAAFIMAELTDTPYASICKAALFPALLYYFSIYLQVHHRAVDLGLKGLDRKDLPNLWVVIKKGAHLTIALFVLIFLLIKGYTPTFAAVVSILVSVVLSYFRKETRMKFNDILVALETGTKNAIMVSVSCGLVGIIVGGIMLTGMGGKFGHLVMGFSKSLPIALGITALTCSILGCGVPLGAAYLLTAVLAAPVLIEMGLPLIAAHLFIIYFALMSALTPPVCVAAYAASTLANASYIKIGFQSMRLSIVAFIVPFMFITRPQLLLMGPWAEVLEAIITAALGVICLAAALEGRMFKFRRLQIWERAGLGFAGVSLMYPGWVSDIIGLALLIIIFGNNWRLRKMDQCSGSIGNWS